MSLQKFGIIGLSLLAGLMPSAGQNLSDAEQKARDLLRQVIEEREGKRPPAKPAAPPATPPAAAPAPVKAAPVIMTPVRPEPGTTERSTPPAGAAQPKPAPRQPTLAEVEQLYLSGEISARQFQKYLRDRRLEPEAGSNLPAHQANLTASRSGTNAPAAATPTVPADSTRAAVQPSLPDAPNDAASIGELERKMEELLRLKAARDNAALAATANTNSVEAATPKTRRERLDRLLRQYISGKISDVEYAQQRARILAEQEPKQSEP